MTFKPAPLNATFFLAGLIGFLLSVLYLIPIGLLSWGIAFGLVFFAMIVASLYSMRAAPLLDEHIVPEFTEPVVERLIGDDDFNEEDFWKEPAAKKSSRARKPAKRKPAKKATKRKPVRKAAKRKPAKKKSVRKAKKKAKRKPAKKPAKRKAAKRKPAKRKRRR